MRKKQKGTSSRVHRVRKCPEGHAEVSLREMWYRSRIEWSVAGAEVALSRGLMEKEPRGFTLIRPLLSLWKGTDL
jgi:hypothetical protein